MEKNKKERGKEQEEVEKNLGWYENSKRNKSKYVLQKKKTRIAGDREKEWQIEKTCPQGQQRAFL
jgi:hypothetical protein